MKSCNVEGLEPLQPEVWISRVEMLAASLQDKRLENGALARLLRLAYHLCLLAPKTLQIEGVSRNSEACLEALLEAGQFDTAAVLLLGTNPMLEIRRHEQGAKVSVRLFAGEAIGNGSGPTMAQAALAAIMECLMMEHELNQTIRAYPFAGNSPRKYQPGSHQ